MENLNENCAKISQMKIKPMTRIGFLNVVYLIGCMLVFVFQMPCEYLSLDTMEKWIVCKCVFKDRIKI